MFECFDIPISKDTIPASIKYAMGYMMDCEKIIDFNHKAYGTPDGECDTDVWTLITVSTIATIQRWKVKDGDWLHCEFNHISLTKDEVMEMSMAMGIIDDKKQEVA